MRSVTYLLIHFIRLRLPTICTRRCLKTQLPLALFLDLQLEELIEQPLELFKAACTNKTHIVSRHSAIIIDGTDCVTG